MGNFISICGRKEFDLQIEQLESKLHSIQVQLKNIQKHNQQLKEEINNLTHEITSTNLEKKRLDSIINHHEKILGNSKAVSAAIIESDLNCRWMDDEKEKEYLINIVKFLHVACNDLTCGLKKAPRRLSSKPQLKKLNTKELFNELEAEADDMSFSNDSSISSVRRY